jgi:16S rRNA (guanine527-N7)-methyltransferase
MFHVEHLAEQLKTGAHALGISLQPDQVRSLADYLALLEKWNAKLNLVGPGTRETWADRHVLDSLAPSRWIGDDAAVVDVGSGAGLPGIPLAVVRPRARIVLVEPRVNRTAFLRNATAALGLKQVEIKTARAETVAERFSLVLGRAVAPPLEFAQLAAGLAADPGKMVLFSQDEPPPALGEWASREDWFDYQIHDQPRRAVGLYRLFHVEHR